MAVNLSALAGAGQQFFDNNGVILTGGKLYSYAAGTTTPQATYTTAAGTIAHANPIILDSAGRVATGEIWLTAGSNYKFVLYTSTDVLIATWDNITGINGTGITSNAVNVTYDPAGTGAVATTVQAKLRQTVSVIDFGADPTGATDSATAFTNAISAAPSTGQRIYVPAGTYLINSKITLNKEILLFGDGCSQTTGGDAATKILKSAYMTTALIDVTSASVSIEHIGFEGVTGNTGDGIHVKAGRCALRNVSSHKMGQDGIRIGGDADENCNLFILDRVFTRNNGRHGVYVNDTLATGGPDVNAGLISLHESASNGGDGLKIDTAWYTTVVAATPQTNTGYGINLTSNSRYNTIVGGDQNESNTAGEVYNAGLRNVFLGTDYSGFTDVGTLTAVIGSSGSKLSSTSFDGTPTGSDIGAVIAYGALGTTIYPVLIRNSANPSNGRGVGIEFQPPDGSSSYRTGARIRVEQSTTNQDNMILSVNESGSQIDFLVLSPNGDYVAPGVDGTISIGRASARWSTVYAVTGTINTSDEREKQDIAELDATEKRVAVALKGLVKKFRFKDAVQSKGENARIHIGVIAQEVIAAFQAEGLDPMRYGIVCYDEWEATEDQPASNRYGVRYEELFAFVLACI